MLLVYHYCFCWHGQAIALEAGKYKNSYFVRLNLQDKVYESAFDAKDCFFDFSAMIAGGNRFSSLTVNCNLNIKGVSLMISGKIKKGTGLPFASGILGALRLRRCNFDVPAVFSEFEGSICLNGINVEEGISVSSYFGAYRAEIARNFLFSAFCGTGNAVFCTAGAFNTSVNPDFHCAAIVQDGKILRFDRLNSRLVKFEDKGFELSASYKSRNHALDIVCFPKKESVDTSGARRSVQNETEIFLNGEKLMFQRVVACSCILGLSKIPERETAEEQAAEIVLMPETAKIKTLKIENSVEKTDDCC